jgi:hypothetical protein
MCNRRVTRSIIAVIAAYAIALQALLTGGAIVAHAAAAVQASDICAADSHTDNSAGDPIGHQTDCPCGAACTMAACDALLGLIDGAGITVIRAAVPGVKLEPNIRSRLALTEAAGRSNLPRAPPIS